MSRVIKMGVAAATSCLNQAGVSNPGAIITGTAFGCMQDTITFSTRIVEEQELMLPPTAFIQSTHNTVAAQIALSLKCHNYNNTFVHKGVSFEHALFDAMLLLNEQEADDILVGGVDEMVDTSFKVLTRLGLYKRHPVSNLQLFAEDSKGTIGGQGAAFFILSDKHVKDDLAELTALKILFKPASIEAGIVIFLKDNGLTVNDVDLVITGKNGDTSNDKIYIELSATLFKDTTMANYKHLCGEYPTSSAFALWLAANIIKKKELPEIIIEKRLNNTIPKRILICNQYQGKYHSLMLVSSVED